MRLHVVPPYAAALAVLFVVLSFRVIQVRRASKVPLGSGGAPDLERRVRVQANFAEYAPFALLLLVTAEVQGASPVLLHGLCLVLLLSRASHAWGVSRPPEDYRFRVAGTVGTLGTLLLAAVVVLVA